MSSGLASSPVYRSKTDEGRSGTPEQEQDPLSKFALTPGMRTVPHLQPTCCASVALHETHQSCSTLACVAQICNRSCVREWGKLGLLRLMDSPGAWPLALGLCQRSQAGLAGPRRRRRRIEIHYEVRCCIPCLSGLLATHILHDMQGVLSALKSTKTCAAASASGALLPRMRCRDTACLICMHTPRTSEGSLSCALKRSW